MNKWFEGVVDDMRTVNHRKAEDYADVDDPYSNFTGAAALARVGVEQGFAYIIGIKVERLRQLMSGKKPNFEAIDDTLLDLANYAALWLGWRRMMSRPEGSTDFIDWDSLAVEARDAMADPDYLTNLFGVKEEGPVYVVPKDHTWADFAKEFLRDPAVVNAVVETKMEDLAACGCCMAPGIGKVTLKEKRGDTKDG